METNRGIDREVEKGIDIGKMGDKTRRHIVE